MARRPPTFVVLLALLVSLLVLAPVRAEAWSRGSIRIAGADRYETAVRISVASFGDGADTVVLASGESFPDGLAAGPLAALEDAPVLLTTKDALPDITAEELERLEPAKVLVVGGPAAVDDLVLAAIEERIEVKPSRIAGATRYDTATAVASLFEPPVTTVFVASGVDFPDALAGGAAASIAVAPLLLTPPDALPAPVGDELARLASPDTIVLGGVAAVSDTVFAAIDERVEGGVRRLFGDDRYATAAAIANDRAADAEEAIIATGASFPDALAAAPLARHLGAPILLTAGCSPSGTTEYLRARDWIPVHVVGGTGAVPEFGLSRPCSPIPDGELAPGLTLQTQVVAGPNVAHIVGITRSNGWDVRATTATGNVLGRLMTTDIGRRLDARVAVNGSFFDLENGNPSYGLAVDGRLLKAPGAGGTIMGLDPTNPSSSFFATPDFDISLGDIAIDKVNAGAPGSSEVAMFTREWDREVDVASDYCRAELKTNGDLGRTAKGEISQVYDVMDVSCSDAPIETGTRDIVTALESSEGGEAIAALVEGDQVTYTWKAHPFANGVSIVIGGNLRLVIGGEVSTDVTMNTGSFFNERAPRTGACTTRNGTLLLVTVDGRQAGYSIGMTPREFAEYLIGIECFDALNLDGGSTALAVDGMLVNRPSDGGGQRPVGSALFVSPVG